MGCMYPRDEIEQIRKNSKTGIQNAADILQWDYVEGLEKNLQQPVKILTRMSLGLYPIRYKKALIRGHRFHHRPDAQDYALGFLNTLPIRPFFFHCVGVQSAVKWARTVTGEPKVFIAYSYAMLTVLCAVKRANPRVKTVLVLLDLPRYTDMAHANSRVYKIKHGLEEKKLKDSLQNVDILVPITEQMRNEIDPRHQIHSVIIDGMVKCRDYIDSPPNDIFTIAYTGTLTRNYGILDIIDAIGQIKDRGVRLVICGRGEVEKEVQEAAINDARIIYRGMVSADEAYACQCSADLLINPRKNEEEYTKYSFPSKILQYMSSGTPVLCYHLDGMCEDYDQFLFYVEQNESLAQSIQRIMAMDREYINNRGIQAREYVLHKKSNAAQTKRILEELDKFDCGR